MKKFTSEDNGPVDSAPLLSGMEREGATEGVASVLAASSQPPQSYLTQLEQGGEVDRAHAQCRFCLGTGDNSPTDPLIAPCLCKGSAKYVHRSCLDQWRSLHHHDKAFTHCGTCGYQFWIQVTENQEAEKEVCGKSERVWKFRGLVARDSVLAFLTFNLVVMGIGASIAAIDSCSSAGGCGSKDGTLFKLMAWICFGQKLCLQDHIKTTYYLMGLLTIFFIMGLMGCFTACLSFGSGGDSNNSCEDCCTGCCYGNYYGPYYGGGYYNNDPCCCWCCMDNRRSSSNNDCDCNGCRADCGNCGGGGGDGAPVLLIIGIVVVVIIIFAGILYGLIAGSMVLSRILQRHYHVLQRKVLTKEFRVMDLDGVVLVPDDPHLPTPTAPDYDDSVLRNYGIVQ